MGTIKVNVWQLGYTSQKDYVLENKSKLQCREMGFVFVEESSYWTEEVWNLLNWGCWSENGKPHAVHSPLDHCNSDIIIQIDGTKEYICALFVGWETKNSLSDAIAYMKHEGWDFWPFHDVRRVAGQYKADNGKAYYRRNKEDKWVEITW